MRLAHLPLASSLFLIAGMLHAQQAPVPWTRQAADAIRAYQKDVQASLEPIYGEFNKLASKAAETPGGPPGSLVPLLPVETLDHYRIMYVLAALPDGWRKGLMAAANAARDQGTRAKAEGKAPEEPHNRFQAEFAGKPAGMSLPAVPRGAADPKTELPLSATLAALEEAGSASGTPEAEKALRAYQNEADRLCKIFGGKVHSKVRAHILKLRLALGKLVPAEAPADWKGLPDDLAQPAAYFVASHYYEGHGGIVGASSATGTGAGDVAGTPSGSGTGAGNTAVEAGGGGTGSGSEAGEPGDEGTGKGSATPDSVKGKPGTGSGKAAGKPSGKGTGTGGK